MVKKGKKDDKEDLGAMRAARFGRVKNTLSMGFGESIVVAVVILAYTRRSCSFLTFH